MKPLCALLCILALLLPGCRTGGDRPDTLVFAYHKGSDSSIFLNALAEFQKRYPDIPVRAMPISGGDYYGKLLVLMAAREAPDVMWIGEGFGEFASRGVFADIGARVQADPALAQDCPPEVLDWYRFGGRLYGVPYGVDMDFIVYNQDLFDAAAVPYPHDDWTQEQFLQAAQKLTRRDASGKVVQYGFQGALDCSAFGASLLTPDHTRPALQSAEMRRYLEFSRDLVKKWRVSPPLAAPELAEEEALQAFQSGRTAMMVGHTWTLLDLRQRMGKIRWEIAPPPAGPRPAHWASSQGLCISRDTRHTEAAWKLVRFLITSDAFWPLMDGLYPTNRRLAERLLRDNRQRPYRLDVMRRAMDGLHPMPRMADLSELKSTYADACDRVFSGRATPDEAMNSASAAITQTLRRRY